MPPVTPPCFPVETETAEEPPADAGDPLWRKRQLLTLRHLECDRLKGLQEPGAADVPSAGPCPALPPRRLTRMDLPQLDPCAEDLGQIANQGAIMCAQ